MRIQKNMKKGSLNDRVWQVFAVMSLVVSFWAPPLCAENVKASAFHFKQVAFDDGMKQQLNRSMPLMLGFPSEYEMLVLDPAVKGVIWGRHDELEKTKKEKLLPMNGGFFHGRLTINIGYDSRKKSFICGPECGEADIEKNYKKAGLKDFKAEKITANGIPLLFIEADISELKGAQAKMLYMAYVATLIDTNVFLISYRPPADSEDNGSAAWKHFKHTLVASTSSAGGNSFATPVQGSLAEEMEMMKGADSHKVFIQKFAQLARDKKGKEIIAILDPAAIQGIPEDRILEAFDKELFPFFAQYQKMKNYEQVTKAQVPDGRVGLWHYTYIVDSEGKTKPFQIAVIDVAGAPNVLSIQVGQCVKGRHPAIPPCD